LGARIGLELPYNDSALRRRGEASHLAGLA